MQDQSRWLVQWWKPNSGNQEQLLHLFFFSLNHAAVGEEFSRSLPTSWSKSLTSQLDLTAGHYCSKMNEVAGEWVVSHCWKGVFKKKKQSGLFLLYTVLLLSCMSSFIAGIKNEHQLHMFLSPKRHIKGHSFHLPQGSFVTMMNDVYYCNSF